MKTKLRLFLLAVTVLALTLFSFFLVNAYYDENERVRPEVPVHLYRRGLRQDESHEFVEEKNHLDDNNNNKSIESYTCRNTVQGKLLLADDQGYVCERRAVDSSGCCSQSHDSTELHVCHKCQETRGCCQIYEHCVSCCLHPNQTSSLESLVSEARARGNNILLSSTSSLFEVCVAQCRTNSRSVHRKNVYVDEKHKFCFDHT